MSSNAPSISEPQTGRQPTGHKSSRRGRGRRPKQIDRWRVADLALDMFARDGFDQVTMQAIAVAAGVSQRTLFRHA